MIAPGHSFVWSSPTAPIVLLKSLFLEHQALRFRFSADFRLYSWSWLFLVECTSEKARRNTLSSTVSPPPAGCVSVSASGLWVY